MSQMLGRLDEAITTYLKALAIDPRSFEANRDITAAYLQLGQMTLAVRYAERATELSPDSQESWTNLAAAYSLQGRYNESVNAYRQAAEQGSLNDRVLLGLANAHIRLGNYPRAINVLNSLIHREPSSTAYERLGYANFKQREFRQALKNFQMSLSLVENDTAALNGVGVCLMTLYIQGGRENLIQRNQAVGAWRKSVQLRPDQPRIVDLISRYKRM
jgi:tetratricopeptide (TPR) repeat protein